MALLNRPENGIDNSNNNIWHIVLMILQWAIGYSMMLSLFSVFVIGGFSRVNYAKITSKDFGLGVISSADMQSLTQDANNNTQALELIEGTIVRVEGPVHIEGAFWILITICCFMLSGMS